MHTTLPGLIALFASAIAYAVFEVGLAVRFGWKEFRTTLEDSESRSFGTQLVTGAVLATVAAWLITPLAIPGDGWAALLVGLPMMWIGVAIRLWAVIALGRFFRLTVVLQPDHRVVTEGPYRFVRHPSYTGMLLVLVGFGIALGNFLSIAICIAIPLNSVRLRIANEETALNDALGDEYRAYSAQTKRLIPGVW
jgi:protein-S-isoprenylcysteine O-methyltransferase Ste14